MNGDILIDVDVESMRRQHLSTKAMVTVAVREFQYQLKYGILDFTADKVVQNWNEKPTKSSWMNIGLYIMEPTILDMIPSESVCSLEHDIFPKVIESGPYLLSFRSNTSYLDIGDLASLDAANQETGQGDFEVR
jgi:NDP-sugar pyrophosphorylase family protein